MHEALIETIVPDDTVHFNASAIEEYCIIQPGVIRSNSIPYHPTSLLDPIMFNYAYFEHCMPMLIHLSVYLISICKYCWCVDRSFTSNQPRFLVTD